MNKSVTAFEELAQLRQAYDSLTRRRILLKIYTRCGWWRGAVLWIATLFLIIGWFILLIKQSSWGAPLWIIAVIVWIFSFNRAQRAVYAKVYSQIHPRLLSFSPQMDTIRYMLFREKVAPLWAGRRERLIAMAALSQDRNDLVNSLTSMIQRNPFFSLLLAGLAIFLGGLAGQDSIWSNGTGYVVIIALSMGIAFLWLATKQSSGVFLTRAYRDREFCFFMKILAEDLLRFDREGDTREMDAPLLIMR